ncbi:hypothetical protein JZ751_024108, partial [Albula glossodonta]
MGVNALWSRSMEMCDSQQNFTMCPLCDGVCDYWHLSTACDTSRASHLFDNPATVFFAVFMSLWAAVFMELWKRRQITLNHSWDLMALEEEEVSENTPDRIMSPPSFRKGRGGPHKVGEEWAEPGKDKWRQRLRSAVGKAILLAGRAQHKAGRTQTLFLQHMFHSERPPIQRTGGCTATRGSQTPELEGVMFR